MPRSIASPLTQGQKHNLDAAKLQACIKAQKDDAVKASVHEGEALGVEATPTMFVNGEKMDGALPIGELRAVLDRALVQAGEPAPVHPAAAPATRRSRRASDRLKLTVRKLAMPVRPRIIHVASAEDLI